jgi:two-component system nitrogen regulation sensor histidine kinase NtrY
MSEETRQPTHEESQHDQSQEVAGDETRARRRSAPWFFGSLVLLLLATLVVLQVSGVWEFVTPDNATDTLVLYALSTLNFVAFVVFSFIFVRSLLKLRRERKARELGSKIKTRLVVYFIVVSLLPITAMAVFSYLFFNRTLEKMFGRIPEDVVNEARLARDEDAAQQAHLLQESARLAALALQRQTATGDAPDLDSLFAVGDFDALAVAADKAVLSIQFRDGATSSARNDQLAEAMKTADPSLQQGGQAQQFVVTPQGLVAAAVQLPDGRTFLAARALQADTRLARIVSGAETFEQLRQRQRKVRLLGLSTLGLLTLLLVFAATWAAIHLARGIGTPIRTLAEAAEEVARGNLAHRVTVTGDDELAVLADTFNQMTAQLEENRGHIEANSTELRETNLALEERRGYIETVLESLSTGVVSLDAENRLTTINAAAIQMLRLGDAPATGTPLTEIVNPDDRAVLDRVLARARRTGRAAWQMELTRGAASADGGVVPVALTATALGASADGAARGVVLVIEDLTELLAAQRAAAWSEVARRMAHEIKNPLTPIQLSAERIARNFPRRAREKEDGEQVLEIGGNGHDTDDRVARIVEECTQTITREVAGLKAMVDEFSRFARLPRARLEAADMNEVVRQAVALYEDRLDEVRLDVLLARSLPAALLDYEQLRRVFVNLLDNALEATAHAEGERRITVATAHDPARGLILAEVADTGHGIARQDFPRLFQPYFSTRGRGTGLGLAIVRHIINDHGGRIRAEQNHPRGAKFLVELPVADETKQDARY